MDKVNALVDRYADQFAKQGVACSVSKRYFETQVDRIYSTTKFSMFDHIIYKRAERKYKHQNNCYHSVLLRFTPIGEVHSKNKGFKEYAFLLRKVERAHIGLAPEKRVYREEQVLGKIEKRIQMMLRKGKTKPAEKVCRDTVLDAMRYMSYKYRYKKKVLGKDRDMIDILLIVLGGVLVLFVALLLSL